MTIEMQEEDAEDQPSIQLGEPTIPELLTNDLVLRLADFTEKHVKIQTKINAKEPEPWTTDAAILSGYNHSILFPFFRNDEKKSYWFNEIKCLVKIATDLKKREAMLSRNWWYSQRKSTDLFRKLLVAMKFTNIKANLEKGMEFIVRVLNKILCERLNNGVPGSYSPKQSVGDDKKVKLENEDDADIKIKTETNDSASRRENPKVKEECDPLPKPDPTYHNILPLLTYEVDDLFYMFKQYLQETDPVMAAWMKEDDARVKKEKKEIQMKKERIKTEKNQVKVKEELQDEDDTGQTDVISTESKRKNQRDEKASKIVLIKQEVKAESEEGFSVKAEFDMISSNNAAGNKSGKRKRI
ncbi:hypothetical protein BCR33DRAFT_743997 [Rhizoclosmatium globosum]|uniref:Uncharacterized protein n=1 Tax=Rhizoclosmatium globosum TaxID=329046 RepID=A0A1Y2BCZ4_9FUNG|nr:hypothetical protein BCR33DRAFT_743997 [Rhizoclosmatium globosum]|eukprot:ORY32708.1 hypothetical protein BCR33DRAFT_743997 [Rhizoclosmatium globosum]